MSTTAAAAAAKPSSLSGTTTTCGSLLQELQEIWDEIGESDCERDNMLLQLEQECLDIYRRKVEKTRKLKADLHQSLTEAEAEINNLISSLGERASVPQYENVKGTLKERISSIKPVLEDLRLKKEKRIKDFLETQLQIGRICAEVAGNSQFINSSEPQVNERDLTLKKLGELKSQLQELQYEKTLRLQRVDNHISTIHALSVVMSLDFNKKITEAHPSLGYLANGQSKSISNETLARLTGLVHSLKQEKQKRLRKLQDLGSTLMELWSLMDTSVEEQKRFDHVTCLISSSVDEVLKQGCLALDVIEQTEVEVERLNVLKGSKMKELVFKRQNELEEIYRGVHMDVDSDTARQILIGLMESGNVNLSDLLSSMDDQILKAKQQALSRKDILDKVEKWKHASEEENWLDEYERDENRYNAGRGAHKNLKRAEKARILVSKIPSLVENLTAKVKAWEIEKGIPFLYDKASLLHMLDEFNVLRQEKEEEKRRSREQKRLQEQFAAEQEVLYGSRPTIKKPLVQSATSNTLTGTPTSRRLGTPVARHGISAGKERRESGKVSALIPVNYVALAKDDSVSRGH
ncbi:Microtubule-associated protein [Actinidia chinensis var. chinensis]|uniref:Microtubule-associated protein n=1 Tax=Actinidia chinensis var. chinensis TaxID=1590841 RepID=A0A2R6RA00_ACTCC|nr:Microtubule-associated protein [Actinidia chinensis var. chinensis]